MNLERAEPNVNEAERWRIAQRMRHMLHVHKEILGILLLGAVLDLFRLGVSPMWRDEVVGILFARLPPASFAYHVLKHEPYQTLYYFFLYPWVAAFGDSALAARLLSVIFALLTVATLYNLASLLFDRRVAVTAALMLSVNVFFIQYAQEARAYSLTAFLAVSSWLLLVRCAQRPSFVSTSAYVLVSAMAPWAQFLVAAMYPAQVAALTLFIRPKKKSWRHFMAGSLIIGASIAAVAWLIVRHDIGQSSWLRKPRFADLINLACTFAGAPFGRIEFTWTVRIGYAVGILSGALVMLTKRYPMSNKRFAGFGCAILAGLVPPVLVFIASQITPMFAPRYMLMSLPFLVLFVAVGLCAIRPLVLSAALVILIVAFSLPIDRVLYASQAGKPAWFDGINYIRKHGLPTDKMILVPGYCRLGLDYNLERSGGPAGFPTIEYPQWDGFMQYGGRYVNDRAVMQPNPLLTEALKPVYSRLWLVSCDTGDFQSDDVLNAVSSQYGGCTRKIFRGLTILFCSSGRTS
jgi:hypothetical protein